MEETSDTLRLADAERAKQGIHELEFSFGGEGDLHTHFQKCQKNPGHHEFIPVRELNTFHLPKHLATDKLVAWIKRMSQLTVKISMNYVSPNRPPGYLLWKRRGQRVLFVGSGHVTEYPREGDIEKIPCPFPNCADLPGDHEVYGYITIVTAAHVVFDDEEAKNTTVEFFYDDSDDKRGVVTVRGVKVRTSSIEGDFCELLCVTHDIYLIGYLIYNSLTISRRRRHDCLLDTLLTPPRCTSRYTAKLFVNYVSPNRPSGYPLSDRAGQRVVSVGSGRVVDVSLEGNTDILTCPFTHCFELSRYWLSVSIIIITTTDVVFDDEEAKNTIVKFFYDCLDGRRHVVTVRGVNVGYNIEGDFCNLFCVTHDTFLIRQLIYNLLTAKNRHQNNMLGKLMQLPICTTHQTAKLSVNYVSPNRPSGYLLSDRAGQRILSVGSGCVTGVSLKGNNGKVPCPLTNCADLPGYHEVCGYITIATTAHVVFDDEEAKNTIVEFFYNDRRHVVTARGVRVRASSIEGDFCELLCVTHDTFLIGYLTYNLLTVEKMEPTYHLLGNIITWPICTSHHIAKLSVNYISPNRPPGYPLSERAGQGVVSIGSGRVTEVSLEGDTGRQPCPFTNCADLPGYHEVCGYITIVTARHVVFDDEEAKHTTVEFFYDDPDNRRHVVTARGVKVRTSSIGGDFCELVCVTHDELFGKWKDIYLQKSMTHKKRFCDLFRRVLPGLESIQCERGTGLKFIVKIRLNKPSEAVETLIVLMTLTEEMISVLKHWDFSDNSLKDVLESARCQRWYMHNLICFELDTAIFIDNGENTTTFLHLNTTLKNLLDTSAYSNIDSPQMWQNMFSSLIIELAKYYSTAEIMEKRLHACSSYMTEIYSRNVQKIVDISNDIATVEVTFDRNAHFTTLHHQNRMGYFERISYYKECKSNDTEYEHGLHPITCEDCDFRRDKCLSVGGMNKTDMEHIELPSDYACKLCNRKYKHQSKSSEDSKCNEDDMILVHIGHPHGQSKRVTIGRQTDCFTGDGFYHQLYTAPTCPGCSGGPVWMIPASGDLSDVYGVPHHGHHGNELNSGCSWTMYPHKIDS